MNSFELNQKLLTRAQEEYHEFMLDLETLHKGEIIEKASEITLKQEIVKYVENNAEDIPLKVREYLVENDEYILSSIYDRLKHNIADTEIDGMFEEIIGDEFSELIFEASGQKIEIDKNSNLDDTKEESLPSINDIEYPDNCEECIEYISENCHLQCTHDDEIAR